MGYLPLNYIKLILITEVFKVCAFYFPNTLTNSYSQGGFLYLLPSPNIQRNHFLESVQGRQNVLFAYNHYYTFFKTKQYLIQSTHKIWVSTSYSLFVIKFLEENVLTPQTRVIKAGSMIRNCNKRHFIWSFSSIFKDLKVVLFHKVKTF